ncbi:GrpB family protein [Streptomyces sp. DSM 44915]|uniref:GrpB family protein n=1 Tax=Streptomyces chisholmiae TaxID=3075540 RepID=A0ABU2JJL2_9ACTN|nr:GrpB family protein [Streptomyces sp. DSM 44915]MDT0264879.1 GrpB family protein [Streptomyces sp. DSM 44915]
MPFPDEIAPVEVLPHRAHWAGDFDLLAAELSAALGPLALAVDHVGSTSVPGLAAKDCVDIQVRVAAPPEPASLAPPLTALGYRLRPEPWNRKELSGGVSCRKLVFAPPVGAAVRHNVHLRAHDGPNARFALLFRDHLRADAAARDAWGAFKTRLVRSAPDLFEYGQIKASATTVLMLAAERWAADTGWRVPPPPARPPTGPASGGVGPGTD